MKQEDCGKTGKMDPVTAQEIAEWLGAHRKTATWLADTLGVAPSTATRWIKGAEIPAPMDKLLRLLLRGEIPFGLLPARQRGVLEFSPAEWRVIELLRVREGFDSAHAWIAAKIRAYLAMGTPAGLKVADDKPAFRVKQSAGETQSEGGDDAEKNDGGLV